MRKLQTLTRLLQLQALHRARMPLASVSCPLSCVPVYAHLAMCLARQKTGNNSTNVHIRFGLAMLQAWQLKLIPLEDVPTKGAAKPGGTAAPAAQTPTKEYGLDLPFRLPEPGRTADDVVLALCAGPGSSGAAPADDR